MISPRILFQGNPTEAYKYVEVAKKFARSMFAAGIISKVWKVSEGVTIRVINDISAKICKVWIEAIPLLGGYQFYTTSPDVEWVSRFGFEDFYPGGSGVYVPYPKLAFLPGGTEIDKENTKIKAKATKSLVEIPYDVTDTKKSWDYEAMPTSLEFLTQKIQDLFVIKNTWQVNGLPESVYYEKQAPFDPTKKPNSDDKSPEFRLFESWVQQGAQIYGSNAHFPINSRYVNDTKYDAAPGKIKKPVEGQAPDTDWFGKSCTQLVGGRRFIILHDASGDFYCWPTNAELDPSEYDALYTDYANQAYKANVIPDHAKKVTPSYPGWVHTIESPFRIEYKADSLKQHLEPRYSFSYNQNGTKGIAVLIEREETEGEFYETDYTTGLQAAEEALWNEGGDLGTPIPAPEEVAREPLTIDQSGALGGTANPLPVTVDRRGYVELKFDISITGDEIEDFDFSIGVNASQSPNDLDALDQGILVNVAYAAPLQWNKSHGYYLTTDTFDIAIDDILSVWVEIYQHEDQLGLLDSYDGDPSFSIPTKTLAKFYNGYPENGVKFLTLPLSQKHGDGYTYTIDPENPPPDPHLFVRNTNQTTESLYPWFSEEGESPELYYYSATITDLDLSTLSFYYTTRLLEQKRSEDFLKFEYPNLYGYSSWAPVENKAKKWCTVIVMGKVIDEVEAGHTDVPTEWLRGWVREMPEDDLTDGEELLDIDFKHGLNGIGVCIDCSWFTWYRPSISAWRPPLESNGNGEMSWVNQQGTLLGGVGQIDYIGASPWWLTGPCRNIVYIALNQAVNVDYFPGFYGPYSGWDQVEWDEKQYVNFPLNWYTISCNYTLPQDLNTMGEGDIPAFLEFVYDFYDNFSFTVNWSDPIYGTDETYAGFTPYIASNPFSVGRVGMSKSRFASEARWLMWHIVKTHQDRDRAGTYMLNSLVLQKGGGLVTNANLNLLLPEDDNSLRSQKKQYHIANFELGQHYYNYVADRHFNTTPLSAHSKILVTPEGHVSYCKRDVFEITKMFATLNVLYNGKEYTTAPDEENVGTPVQVNKLDFTYFPDYTLTSNDISWKLLDGVSWFYGEIKTRHLDLYNLAYRDERSETDDPKPYLISEEEYTPKYQESDFKPSFVIEKTDAFDGYFYIRPYYPYEDGYAADLQYHSLPILDGVCTTWAAGPDYVDPRPGMRHLRLSPLFF